MSWPTDSDGDRELPLTLAHSIICQVATLPMEEQTLALLRAAWWVYPLSQGDGPDAKDWRRLHTILVGALLWANR